MSARERFAWCAFAVTVVALAAAVILPTHKAASVAPATLSVDRADDGVLARIDARLARLEALERARHATAPAGSAPLDARAVPMATADAIAAPPGSAGSASAATEQSRLAGTALVERAIAAGYWSRNDAQRWRALSAGMRGEDRFGLQRRLIAEMNADRLKIEPGVLPQ